MDTETLRSIRDFAIDIARDAGHVTLKYFQKNVDIELKSDQSPVTVADREAEALLRDRIEQAYPEHGILGEEHGTKEGQSPGRWIVDPIDGTFSFICGVPMYSNLVGFEWAGKMVVGVINLPALNEIVYAADGLGCMWNTQVARVSNVDDLSRARVSTTSIKTQYDFNGYDRYRALIQACKTDRGWADAYGYSMLATGRVDVVVDPIMSIWDVAALLPIVQEAGGTLSNWQGQGDHTQTQIVATNGLLFDAVIQTLSA